MKSDSEDKELETGTGEFVNADDAAEAEEQLPDEIGDVKVADEVISIVAGLAAQEVNGVIGMSGSFAEKFCQGCTDYRRWACCDSRSLC